MFQASPVLEFLANFVHLVGVTVFLLGSCTVLVALSGLHLHSVCQPVHLHPCDLYLVMMRLFDATAMPMETSPLHF